MTAYSKELLGKLVRGHALMYDDDARLLHTIASRGKTYAEIGTYCGGSAIVAGLAGCEVWAVDAFEYPEDMKTFKPTPEDVLANWDANGLDIERLHVYKHRTPGLPPPMQQLMFDIGFIDGGHDAGSVWADWTTLNQHIDMYMLFHDANRSGPYWCMLKVLKEDRNWGRVALPIGCTTTMRILKRIGR